MGRVADVVPYMAQARIAIVPDLLGGFKLKCLDYIFNRLPIFAIDGAVPGLPFGAYSGILTYKSHLALALGAIAAVDNLPLLNSMQNQVFDECQEHFHWQAIGRNLSRAFGVLGP